MAPKTIKVQAADELEEKYGEQARECGDIPAYQCRKALQARSPAITVSVGVLKQWIMKYRVQDAMDVYGSACMVWHGNKIWYAGLPPDAVVIADSADLERRYGSEIRPLTGSHTGLKFMLMLKKRNPPLYVTEQTAKNWLRVYGSVELVQIDNADNLEVCIGERIRNDAEAKTLDADALANWLHTRACAIASVSVCQTWLNKDGKDSGTDAGPLKKYNSAKELEKEVGDEIRHMYNGYKARHLQTSLAARPKAVLASTQTCRTWLAQYSNKESSTRSDAGPPAGDAGPLHAEQVARMDVIAKAGHLEELYDRLYGKRKRSARNS
jgi:hypothetical protein